MNRLPLVAIRQLFRFWESAVTDMNGFRHLNGLGVICPSEDGNRVLERKVWSGCSNCGQKEAEAEMFTLYSKSKYRGWGLCVPGIRKRDSSEICRHFSTSLTGWVPPRT
jgi:hypothetical protein